MTNYFGSQHSLDDCVKRHLFLLCPNNSGSTFLINAIKTSRAVWALQREGQHVLGFSGPATLRTEFPLLWASKPEWIERFQNPDAYDWSKSKKAWYFQASARRPDAPVFATKSPPFLLIADQLAENFPDTRFIFMVRNPYPVIESITRKHQKLGRPLEECATMAARHIITCFRQQIENKDRYKDQSVFFRYEDMCANPAETAKIIQSLVPEMTDLDLDQKLPVK